jgi:hypothetical protein
MKKLLSILCVTLLSASVVLGCQFTILNGVGFVGVNYFQLQPGLRANGEITNRDQITPITTNLPITFWFRSIDDGTTLVTPDISEVCLWYACGTLDDLKAGVTFKQIPNTNKEKVLVPKTFQAPPFPADETGETKFTIYGNYTLQLLNIANNFPDVAKKIQAKSLTDENPIYIIVIWQCTLSNGSASFPEDPTNSKKYFDWNKISGGSTTWSVNNIVSPRVDANNCLILKWNGQNKIVGR